VVQFESRSSGETSARMLKTGAQPLSFDRRRVILPNLIHLRLGVNKIAG
jgi:hypothetical protein